MLILTGTLGLTHSCHICDLTLNLISELDIYPYFRPQLLRMHLYHK